jgi:DNA-binding CsgD family transcriptional regulator
MPIPQPDLVGRDAELEVIDGFLTGLQDTRPTALVLEGEAGIGKTTLWRAGLTLARDRSFRVLIARPTSAEAGLPFSGLSDLLSESLEDVLTLLPAPQRQALEVALLLIEPGGAPPQPHTIAAAVLSCLRELSRTTPVLVAIDDVQWLDSSTTAAVEFARRRIGTESNVAFLLSLRPTDEEGARTLLGADEHRDGHVHHLRVGPLSLGALHRVIATHLGHSLPRPVLARIHATSGGNPFFALELARVAEQRGAPSTNPELPLPASLADTLHERLNVLPADTREALLTVATLSAPTLESLEQALGSNARLRLQPALDAGMLALDDQRVRFAHPLIAATVYSEAWPEQRHACHRALAEIVGDPDERARHLALSSRGPDAELAQALEDAAHRARLRGAPEAAAALVEQSWTATPPDDADGAWRRGLLASEYHLQSGDMGRFRELTEGLLPTARTGDERSMTLALLSIAPTGAETGRSLLDRALAEAESTRQRQSVESDYVVEASLGGDLTEGARHAREALRLAEELDDPSALADALCAVARLEQLLGLGLRRDLLDRADALHELRQTDRLEETVGLVRTTITSCGLLATADELDEARHRSTALQQVLEEQGLVQPLPEVLRFRAELECWAGNWNLAADLADAGDELADQTGRTSTREDILYPRAFVAAHRGHHETARALALEGVAAGETRGNHRNLLRHLAVLGLLELSLDDPAGAAANLERAAEVAAAAGFVEPNWLRFHGDLCDALIGLGRLDDAAALVDWLEECGRATSYPWTLATAARCRGLLLAGGSELDAAADAFAEAIAVGQRLGNSFELARTRLDLGRVIRRKRQRVEARAMLNEALLGFEELGAELWAETTRRELGRISGRRAGGPDQLTEAERRIAELVAGGSSNKQVAAALVVTVHTVEAALTRVYRKLEVRSRTELAARFAAEPKEST